VNTRTLVYEDDEVRRYEVYDDAGNLVGEDVESKRPPEQTCPTCGGRGYLT
jgi:hypothetical protein